MLRKFRFWSIAALCWVWSNVGKSTQFDTQQTTLCFKSKARQLFGLIYIFFFLWKPEVGMDKLELERKEVVLFWCAMKHLCFLPSSHLPQFGKQNPNCLPQIFFLASHNLYICICIGRNGPRLPSAAPRARSRGLGPELESRDCPWPPAARLCSCITI